MLQLGIDMVELVTFTIHDLHQRMLDLLPELSIYQININNHVFLFRKYDNSSEPDRNNIKFVTSDPSLQMI